MRTPEELGLTEAEWSLILDANNGHLCLTDERGQRLLSSRDELEPNVQDHLSLNRADLHHGVHADAFRTKLAGLSDEDWDVVMAVVEGFWGQGGFARPGTIPGRGGG